MTVFTARIRAADEQKTIVSAERQSNGHHFLSVDQRVAAPIERDDPRSVDGGLDAGRAYRRTPRGHNNQSISSSTSISWNELLSHKSHAAGELAEDPFHLLFLVDGEGTEFVVHFENLLGLDKESGAAGGTVVNESL